MVLFIITFIWTIYFKIQEASEAQIEAILKEKEKESELKPIAENQEQESGSPSPVKLKKAAHIEKPAEKVTQPKVVKKEQPPEPQDRTSTPI